LFMEARHDQIWRLLGDIGSAGFDLF
jgi:hypothetical protein